MVREGELLEPDTLSELGISGAFLGRGDKVLMNNEAGHLIRTKVTSDWYYLSKHKDVHHSVQYCSYEVYRTSCLVRF